MTDDKKPPVSAAELRDKAEKVARTDAVASTQNIEVQSPAETRRLLHELRVHQIELEIQNEELRRAKDEVEVSRERFEDLYDFAPVGYCTLSEKGLILEINLTATTMLGFANRRNLIGKRMAGFVLSDDQDIYYRHRGPLFRNGTPQVFELRLVREGGALFWARFEAMAIKDKNGVSTYRFALIDITESKRTEGVQVFLAQTSSHPAGESFLHQLARYLAKSLAMDFVCIDRLEKDNLAAKTLAVWCDGYFEDNVSYALHDTPGGDVVAKQVCCFPAGVRQFFPRDQVLQDLKAESYVGVTLFSHTGQPIGLIAVIGRTRLADPQRAEKILQLVAGRAAGELERLYAEEKIQQNLLEKKTLLREIHHRVKNNMAVISSLLRLQADQIKDDSMKELFDESRQRIKAMALVHEKLYRTESLARIDFDDYITSVAGELVSAYHTPKREIITRINARNMVLDIDTALPCGLIINELLTNALKHAYKEQASGELCIDLKKVDTTYTLTVQDNGIGMPDGFDHTKAQSMGLELVTVLVRQLLGTLQFQANGAGGQGTRVIITFKEKDRA